MKKSHLKKALTLTGLAVVSGVLAMGINAAMGATPAVNPPGTGVAPTFTGLTVNGAAAINNSNVTLNPGNTTSGFVVDSPSDTSPAVKLDKNGLNLGETILRRTAAGALEIYGGQGVDTSLLVTNFGAYQGISAQAISTPKTSMGTYGTVGAISASGSANGPGTLTIGGTTTTNSLVINDNRITLNPNNTTLNIGSSSASLTTNFNVNGAITGRRIGDFLQYEGTGVSVAAGALGSSSSAACPFTQQELVSCMFRAADGNIVGNAAPSMTNAQVCSVRVKNLGGVAQTFYPIAMCFDPRY